ncbi:hypothetical protein FRC06_006800 [Ceratobasidium sp. 370]|nr:hypothetical protein FRC06_006800 [Ceratobasidium sp. 370]
MSLMSTEAYEPLLLEFKAFVACPPAQQNPLELLNLLRRIFPLASLPVCSPSEPFNPLSFIDPGYNVSWTPKTETTSMAPHNKRCAGKAHQAPRPINVVPAENIATDLPPQVTVQHEYHPQYPVGNTPLSEHGSTAEQPPDATPFFDYSAHHPVLPPISTLLGPAPQVAAMSHPQMAARPSGTYEGAPAPAP